MTQAALPGPADADAGCRGRAVVAGARLAAAADAAVVDDAVAVVIQIVAVLGAGQPPAAARAPVAADAARARDAGLRAVGADPDPRVCRRARRSTRASRPRCSCSRRRRCRRNRCRCDRTARDAAAPVLSHGPHSEPFAVVTQLLPPRAHGPTPSRRRRAAVAGAAVARLARAAVVDGPVAVVVQPVAQVAVGPDVPSHAPQKLPMPPAPPRQVCIPSRQVPTPPVPPAPRSTPLRADVAQATVVDLAVAVVVEPVAHLGLRRHRVLARPPAAELRIAGHTCLPAAHARPPRDASVPDNSPARRLARRRNLRPPDRRRRRPARCRTPRRRRAAFRSCRSGTLTASIPASAGGSTAASSP